MAIFIALASSCDRSVSARRIEVVGARPNRIARFVEPRTRVTHGPVLCVCWFGTLPRQRFQSREFTLPRERHGYTAPVFIAPQEIVIQLCSADFSRPLKSPIVNTGYEKGVTASLSRLSSRAPGQGQSGDTRNGQAEFCMDRESAEYLAAPATYPVALRARIRRCRVARMDPLHRGGG